MESGSSSEAPESASTQKRQKLGSVLPRLERFVPRKGHDPTELKSWAKRTGFVSTFSGESGTSSSHRGQNDSASAAEFDLEKGLDKHGSASPKIEIDPVLGRTRNEGFEFEIEPVPGSRMQGLPKNGYDGVLGSREGTARGEIQRKRNDAESGLGAIDEENKVGFYGNANGPTGHQVTAMADPKKDDENVEAEVGVPVYPDGGEPDHGGWNQSSRMKIGLRENPGWG